MITRIQWENLKGANRELELKPLTVITGRNHAGKSAVLNALTLAGLGYIPSLGKTNAATFRLASGKKMTVKATNDRNQTVTRVWQAKGNGVTAATEGDDGPFGMPLAVIDPPTFIAANAKTRLAMLAGLAGGDALKKLAEQNVGFAARLKAPRPGDDRDALQVAAELRDLAAAKAKSANDTVKAHTATLQTLAGDERLAVKVSEADRKAARQRVEKATAAKVAAERRAADMENAANAADDATDELETLQEVGVSDEVISRLRAAKDSLTEKLADLRVDLSQKRAEQGERQRELTSLARLTADKDIDDAAAVLAEAIESKATPEGLEALKAEKKRVDEAVMKNRGARGRLEGARDTAAKNIAALEDMECCPVCMAAEDGWKKKALQAYQADKALAEDELAGIQEHDELLRAEHDELVAKIAKTTNELSAKAKIPALQEIVDAFTKAPRLTAKISEHGRAITDIEQVIAGVSDELREATEELASLERGRAEGARRAELARIIAARPAEADVNASIDAANDAAAELDAARAALEDIEQRATAAAQADTVTAKIADCESVIERENTVKNEMEALKDEIAAALDNAIVDAYTPIIGRVAEFGSQIIDRAISVNEDGEIGYKNTVGFVPFEAMSGTEQTIVIAAIQAALSEANGSILMIDEISRLDAKNKRQFAENVAASIAAGRLQQAVIVDHDGPAWSEFYTIAIE